MSFRVVYTKKALDDLSSLDKKLAKRIFNKITFFSKQEDPLSYAKKLKDFQHSLKEIVRYHVESEAEA